MITLAEIPSEILEAIPPVESVSEPGFGCTSEVALLQAGSQRFLLKRSRGEQFRRWLRREFDVLQALIATDLPVPQAHAFVADDTAGVSWLLMDFMPGQPVEDYFDGADEAERERLFEIMGRTLRRLHDSPIPPKIRRRSATAWLDHMLQEAENNLNDYGTDGDETLLTQLQHDRPAPAKARLIHGDFTFDNVLLTDDGTVSIIDWSGGAVGDPRYDLALALTSAPERYLTEATRQAFFRAYGAEPISDEQYHYFVGLYEFF